MILNSADTKESDWSVLRACMASEMAAKYSELRIASYYWDEILGSVVDFCRSQIEDGCLSSDSIALCVARSLWCLGEKDAALRVLELESIDRNVAIVYLDYPEGKALPVRLLRLLNAGLIRPSCWTCENNEVVWVLDFDRLVFEKTDCLEIVFWQVLRVLLEQMGRIWDASGGEGILGLRGLANKANPAMRGRNAKKSLDVKPRNEVVDYCVAALQHMRTGRGWLTIPSIIDLDVRSSRPARQGPDSFFLNK